MPGRLRADLHARASAAIHGRSCAGRRRPRGLHHARAAARGPAPTQSAPAQAGPGKGFKSCPDCGQSVRARTTRSIAATISGRRAALRLALDAGPQLALAQPTNPWLAECAPAVGLRRHVEDGDWRAALDYLQENYVDEDRRSRRKDLRRNVPTKVSDDAPRPPRQLGWCLFPRTRAGVLRCRAPNLLSCRQDMGRPTPSRRRQDDPARARWARRGILVRLQESVLDQCQLRVVPSFWGRVDGAGAPRRRRDGPPRARVGL